jgi:hypothetical protein
MLKKIFSMLLALTAVLAFSGLANANVVTIKLDNLYPTFNIASFQMDFVNNAEFSFPFLYDENDIFRDREINFSTDFGSESAIIQTTTFKNNWYLDFFEDYNDQTQVATASGFFGASNSTSDAFALRNGFLVSLTSDTTEFAVDPASMQFFNFVDTAHPIGGLVKVETFDLDNNQLITVSPVPIPSALLLLGSGLFGMIAVRRRRA